MEALKPPGPHIYSTLVLTFSWSMLIDCIFPSLSPSQNIISESSDIYIYNPFPLVLDTPLKPRFSTASIILYLHFGKMIPNETGVAVGGWVALPKNASTQ